MIVRLGYGCVVHAQGPCLHAGKPPCARANSRVAGGGRASSISRGTARVEAMFEPAQKGGLQSSQGSQTGPKAACLT